MYGYITLSDNTGIAHSEMRADGTVKVYFERPVEGGFHSAICYLPSYRWESVDGFSQEELKRLDSVLHNNAHLILEYAQEGGFSSAAGY